MSENVVDPAFIKKIDEIIDLAVSNGGLMFISTNGSGKSNAGMWIARRIMDNPKHESHEYKMTIFDTVYNWRYNFDKIPFVDSRSMRLIPIVQDLIVDISDLDPIDTRNNISSILIEDYLRKQELKIAMAGKLPFINFYVIEEMQNVFGTYALGQKTGRFNLKLFSEGRNFGMCFIGLGQRIADISPKVIERRRYYLLGRANGDNDLQKIARMFNPMVAEHLKALQMGSFIFFDKETNTLDEIGFPIFKQMGTPQPLDLKKVNGYVKRVYG